VIERPVAPTLRRLFILSASITVILFTLGIWVDGRLGSTGVISMIASVGLGAGWAITFAEDTSYTKKPRGWRKLRRHAEERAYIEKLERELL
jgi:hypothetical protein